MLGQSKLIKIYNICYNFAIRNLFGDYGDDMPVNEAVLSFFDKDFNKFGLYSMPKDDLQVKATKLNQLLIIDPYDEHVLKEFWATKFEIQYRLTGEFPNSAQRIAMILPPQSTVEPPAPVHNEPLFTALPTQTATKACQTTATPRIV
jgi:hypothetical protein